MYCISIDDIMSNNKNPIKLNQQKICLKLENIEVFRTSIVELHHGVTGGLYFSGEGIERIVPKCFIRVG